VRTQRPLRPELRIQTVHDRCEIPDQRRRQDILQHEEAIPLELIALCVGEAMLQARGVHSALLAR